jgi:GMP synthase (glutamine-hydrolysing)
MNLLLVLCGDPEPSVAQLHGDFPRWFARALPADAALRVFDPRVSPCASALLDGVDAVILSGSSHSSYDPLPWIAPLEALLREAIFARRLPLLGVCFGHQLVAQACGGRVVKNPRGREIGTAWIELNAAGRASALFEPLPERFAMQVTHCDTVIEPPPGATVLARSALDDCQAYRFETAWGVQFHPEFTAEVIRAYLRARRAVVQAEGLDPDALLAAVRESDAGVRLLARFTELVRAARPTTASAALPAASEPTTSEPARAG